MPSSFSSYNPAMKRRTRRLALLASTILVIACMALIRAITPASATMRPVAVTAPTFTPYLVKAQGNQLAIFVAGEASPVLVTEVDVRALPQVDQDALASGITVDSDEALAKLLEDYGS